MHVFSPRQSTSKLGSALGLSKTFICRRRSVQKSPGRNKTRGIMSKSTFTILFYARKNQVNRAGKAGIMIRVTVNGESVQFSSKLDIEPELWDTTNQKMIGTTKAAREFNALLDDIRTSLRNHYREIEKYEAYVTAEKVRNAFLGITVRQQTLLGAFRRHNEDVQKLVGISKSAATYRKYDRCFQRVEEFIQVKYRVKDIALKEVTHSFLVGFEQYLRTEKRCCQNTAAKFLQTLRMIIIIMIFQTTLFTLMRHFVYEYHYLP